MGHIPRLSLTSTPARTALLQGRGGKLVSRIDLPDYGLSASFSFTRALMSLRISVTGNL